MQHEFSGPDAHVDAIVKTFEAALRPKYMRGLEEHGGKLWRKNARHLLREEVVDLFTYFDQLDRQVDGAIDALLGALDKRNWRRVREALNLLVVGNRDGIREEDR